MSVTINGTNGFVFNDNSTQNTSPFTGGFGFRNRIINGAMVIDQRNAGASVTVNGASVYTVDRWQAVDSTDGAFSAQQDSSAPAGFVNSLKITTTTADATLTTTQSAIFRQSIEGTNTADLAWGTASAKTVTLSFWVRSSLTGTFGGAVRNSDASRSYPFTYTISLADTWEQKSVVIEGDTSGTWLTTTGVGVQISFGLGVGPDRSGTAGAWAGANVLAPTGAVSVIGTLNATWYITGVQLEKGSTATSFDYRPYGTELALCQRYFEKSYDQTTVPGAAVVPGICLFPINSVNCMATFPFAVEKRATPSISVWDAAGTANAITTYNGSATQANGAAQGAPVQTVGTRNVTLRNSNTVSGAITGGYQWTASIEL